MVDQIRKPGVNITQVFEETPPTPVTATLVPCIVGPAFEVVELTGEDGTASTESRVNTDSGPLLYTQFPRRIPVSEYPTPRADSTQMSVLVPEVEVALQRTGEFNILDRNPGTAFLKSVNIATRPGIWISEAQLQDRIGATFIILVDTNITNNAASYVVSTGGQANAQELVEHIVSQVPGLSFVAHTLNTVSGFILHSARFGATASISLISASGGSTSTVFFNTSAGESLDFGGVPLTQLRVEGSGFYAESNPIPTILTSPVVKHSEGSGAYQTNGALTALSDNAGIGILDGGDAVALGNFASVQLDVHGAVIETHNIQAIDFTGAEYQLSAATSRSDGDLFTASGPFGQSISKVMVTEVRSDYIKLGVVNTQRSVYDAEGNIVRQVYNDFQLNTRENPVPFAPKNGFFTAQSLRQYSPINGNATVATHISNAVAISPEESATVGLQGWTEGDANLYATFAFDLILTINGVSETITAPFEALTANEHINTVWAEIFDQKISRERQ